MFWPSLLIYRKLCLLSYLSSLVSRNSSWMTQATHWKHEIRQSLGQPQPFFPSTAMALLVWKHLRDTDWLHTILCTTNLLLHGIIVIRNMFLWLWWNKFITLVKFPMTISLSVTLKNGILFAKLLFIFYNRCSRCFSNFKKKIFLFLYCTCWLEKIFLSSCNI